MDITAGLDVTGLDMTQISQKLTVYVESHIKSFKLSVGASLFMECHVLHFEEVKGQHLPEHYHYIFKDNDIFNGAAGFVEVDGREWDIMMLADKDFTTVYLLFMQYTDTEGKTETVVIKDFLEQAGT